MKRLVYIRYRDHVLFRNTDPSLYHPAIRECVGWVVRENKEILWILWDRSVQPLPHERIRPQESGLVILKSDIIEMRELR
ncbi:MAG: hypothetical protein ACE5OW_06380 [Candidatus Bathyarchaeia archaeon]